MTNNNKMLIVLTGVLGLVFLLGIYFYFNKSPAKTEPVKTEETKVPTISQGPKKGELEYQEPQTKIQIGTQGITKGVFEKVEAGNIFLKEGDTLTQLPLTVDEVAISCTTQNLSTAAELDFNQVKKVKVVAPSGVAALIPANEPVVVFAQVVEGVNRVHTIAMDASKCTP